MTKTVSITGQFNWEGKERRSDRYGGIMLLGPHDSQFEDPANVSLTPFRQFIGRRVVIVARVLETRESYHIGDLSRGIKPKTPKVGWTVELGTGKLHDIELIADKLDHLLFQRDEAGSYDWMDPNILYRLHHQTVELTISEAVDESSVVKFPEPEISGFSADFIPVGPSMEKPGWTDLQIKTRLDR